MAIMETDWRDQITIDPAIKGGRPVIKGTRMPVHIVVGSLAGGMSIEEVCEEYTLTEEQVRAALGYWYRDASALGQDVMYAVCDVSLRSLLARAPSNGLEVASSLAAYWAAAGEPARELLCKLLWEMNGPSAASATEGMRIWWDLFSVRTLGEAEAKASTIRDGLAARRSYALGEVAIMVVRVRFPTGA